LIDTIACLEQGFETIRPRNIALQRLSLWDVVCEISDIVKRRSIRVGSCKQLRGTSLSPDHFGARASQDERVVNDPFSEA
jgi:hypothetical protein